MAIYKALYIHIHIVFTRVKLNPTFNLNTKKGGENIMIVENELREMQEQALKKPSYKRKTVQPEQINDNDLTPLFDMALKGLTRHAKYTNDEIGLNAFKELSIEYLKELATANETASENGNMRLCPDIESWAMYLGISRTTIYNYESTYNDDWKTFIADFKNTITSFKKSLAFAGKFSPVLLIFDLTNNSKYYNSSEFNIKSETTPKDTVYLLPSEQAYKLGLQQVGEKETVSVPDLKESENNLDINSLPFVQ